jgi:preprotein translocase subunit Sec61beta
MADTSIPLGFGGGLTRFKEEYNSKLKFSPSAVVLMIIVVIAFRISLKYFL